MTIRAFVALTPSRAQLDRLEELGLDIGCGRPVPWEDLHVTLAFLGEHDRHVLEDVASELDRIRTAPVPVAFEGIGVFGSRRPSSAHALCVPDPGLSALAESVRRAAEAGGVALKRRKFVPHVTLARFTAEHPADEGLEDWAAAHAGFAMAAAPVGAFSLFRSDLTRHGPVYTEAMRFELQGEGEGAEG